MVIHSFVNCRAEGAITVRGDMIYSAVLLLSALSVTVATTLRGSDVTLAGKNPFTCPTSFKTPGVDCSTDMGCFYDPANYVFSETPEADGSFSVSVKNCIPRSASTSISFISVSDCTNNCQKTDSVSFGTTVFNATGFYGPNEYCKSFCVYAHDGQYKLTSENTIRTEENCISSRNQRCNLCDAKPYICRPTPSPTATPTVEPTAEPTMTPTLEPTAEPTVAPTFPVISNGDGTCATDCGEGNCCCVDAAGSNTCYAKDPYGGSTMECKYICANARCTSNGQQKFGVNYTCNCIKRCNSKNCNALGGGGGGCLGTAVCCCAVRASDSTITTYGAACPDCSDSMDQGWVSLANCNHLLNLA